MWLLVLLVLDSSFSSSSGGGSSAGTDCAAVTAAAGGGAAAALAATGSAAKGVDVDCKVAGSGVAVRDDAGGASGPPLVRLNEEARRLAHISPRAAAGVIRSTGLNACSAGCTP